MVDGGWWMADGGLRIDGLLKIMNDELSIMKGCYLTKVCTLYCFYAKLCGIETS